MAKYDTLLIKNDDFALYLFKAGFFNALEGKIRDKRENKIPVYFFYKSEEIYNKIREYRNTTNQDPWGITLNDNCYLSRTPDCELLKVREAEIVEKMIVDYDCLKDLVLVKDDYIGKFYIFNNIDKTKAIYDKLMGCADDN